MSSVKVGVLAMAMVLSIWAQGVTVSSLQHHLLPANRQLSGQSSTPVGRVLSRSWME